MTPHAVKKRIILDVDTGHDDALAIIMAASDKRLELLGITVTAGNQILEKTLKNTLNVTQALGLNVPVYSGMHRPLLQDLATAERIHGESGLDGPVFRPPVRGAEPLHAVQYLIDTVMKEPVGSITLVAVGPLTNIAMAVRLCPDFAHRLSELIIMGGSMTHGNVTPSAEFNIHADPESASIVFSSGAPLVMIGLDCTTRVTLTDALYDRFAGISGPAGYIFSASMAHYIRSCKQYIGESPAMHDPCCVAWAVNPSIFTWKNHFVAIECRGNYTRGRTIVDQTGVSSEKPNAKVVYAIQPEPFWEQLEASLRHFSNVS